MKVQRRNGKYLELQFHVRDELMQAMDVFAESAISASSIELVGRLPPRRVQVNESGLSVGRHFPDMASRSVMARIKPTLPSNAAK